ncbi:aldehyde dehydrogenase family protein [Xanthobacter wiegelii]|uniref:aldehyde dehydrogenase family protein n=1 Tax=Xanthobacter wiegelii TaxID=3119913 RepID=UPI00372A523D
MSPAAENPLALADPSLLVEAAVIGGQWCAADDGATLVVEDPATGRPVGTVPACGAAETRRAIAAAEAAFRAWRTVPAVERVRKISFTGSTRVGAHLMRASAGTRKKLSLELGGNAPFIVFDDADLDLAVEGAMASKFRNAGQTCVCANRILVQAGIHDAFVARLGARIAAQKVGPGTEPGVAIGPLINRAAAEKVYAHVADALAKGARVVQQSVTSNEDGNFVAPLLLTGATTDMRLANEETFGPVAPVFRFETEAEAIAIANGTPYGLAAYFFTEDMHRAWRVGEALEFGMVGLNTGAISMEVAPFGGVKQSGLGREGGYLGIAEYLEPKAFHMGGLRLTAPV